jgi:hypothetical protein
MSRLRIARQWLSVTSMLRLKHGGCAVEEAFIHLSFAAAGACALYKLHDWINARGLSFRNYASSLHSLLPPHRHFGTFSRHSRQRGREV